MRAVITRENIRNSKILNKDLMVDLDLRIADHTRATPDLIRVLDRTKEIPVHKVNGIIEITIRKIVDMVMHVGKMRTLREIME